MILVCHFIRVLSCLINMELSAAYQDKCKTYKVSHIVLQLPHFLKLIQSNRSNSLPEPLKANLMFCFSATFFNLHLTVLY